MNVADVRSEEPVSGTFLVAAVEVRTTRNGDAYLRMTLRDQLGESIEALFFRVSEAVIAAVEAGQTYEVEGQGDEWRGHLNVKLSGIVRSTETWDSTALLPRSDVPPDQSRESIDAALASIGHPAIRAVVSAVLRSDLVAERLTVWPAAKIRHHAWVGGLAEHMVEMLSLAARAAEIYPDLDRDLLVAGVLLHDLGKLLELEVSADFGYTSEGNLEGHMAQGVRLLDQALKDVECPAETAMLLRHLVLSHQGTREFGAVVEPQIPEAIALHYIDQLSSQIRPAIEDVRKTRARGTFFRGPTSMRHLYAPEVDGTSA